MFFCIFTAILKDSHEGAGTSYRLYDLKAFFCPFLKLNDQRKKKDDIAAAAGSDYSQHQLWLKEHFYFLLIPVTLQLVSQSYAWNIWSVSIHLNSWALTWLRHSLNQKFVGEPFHHKLHYQHTQRPLQPFSDFIGFVLLAGFWQKHGSLNTLKRMNNSIWILSQVGSLKKGLQNSHILAQMHIFQCIWLPWTPYSIALDGCTLKEKFFFKKSMERGLKISRLAKVQACGLVFRTYRKVIYLVHAGAVNYSVQTVLQSSASAENHLRTEAWFKVEAVPSEGKIHPSHHSSRDYLFHCWGC